MNICMGTEDAVQFFEMLPDCIPDEIKSDEFCDEYEKALNRVRWLAARVLPVPVKRHNQTGYRETWNCSKCGAGARAIDKFCHVCGVELDWRHKDGGMK